MVSSKLILLVDDDDDDRFLFKQAVLAKSIGAYVTAAHHGKEALLILEEAEILPDIIFMDVNMPVMNGLDCLKEIKRRPAFCNIRVVMISTAHNDEMQTQLLRAGAYAFSRKPVEFDALGDLILGHLQALDERTR